MIDLKQKAETPEGSIWKHRKTGMSYVVLGHCVIEKTLAGSVIYQHHKNPRGIKWVRPLSEFLDGRFEHVRDKAKEDA
jgi:hypothetical protein